MLRKASVTVRAAMEFKRDKMTVEEVIGVIRTGKPKERYLVAQLFPGFVSWMQTDPLEAIAIVWGEKKADVFEVRIREAAGIERGPAARGFALNREAARLAGQKRAAQMHGNPLPGERDPDAPPGDPPPGIKDDTVIGNGGGGADGKEAEENMVRNGGKKKTAKPKPAATKKGKGKPAEEEIEPVNPLPSKSTKGKPGKPDKTEKPVKPGKAGGKKKGDEDDLDAMLRELEEEEGGKGQGEGEAEEPEEGNEEEE